MRADVLHREWESMNQLCKLNESTAIAIKTGLSSYELLNRSSIFAASSAVQKAVESMGTFRIIQDSIARQAALGLAGYDFGYRSSSFQVGSIAQKALESMNSLNAIKDSLALHKMSQFDSLSNIQKMLGTSLSSSMQKTMDSIKGVGTVRESIAAKVMAGFRSYEEMQKMMELNPSLNIAQKTAMSLLGLNSIQEAVGFRTSSIQHAMKAMQHMKLFEVPDSIAKTIGQMQSSGMFTKTMQALSRDNVFAQAMESFNASAYPGQFAYDISDYELSENISLIENSDEGNFLSVFSKLHPNIKAVILFVFLQILLPQLNSICSNLMTPSVERAISSGKFNTDQIRTIKKTPLQGIETENLRFIYRNDVKVRAKPSTYSEMLDVLGMGQVITVLDRKKSWAEVVYSNDEGQTCRGWVMTTYTAKFKK